MLTPSKENCKQQKTEEINSKKTTLDDFKLIRCIGEGAFGEVYLVKNYFNNKHYALKSIDKIFLAKQKKEHHVYNEKLILQHLDSNLVVKLHATFQDDKKLYFLMENVPNGEVAKYLRQKSKFMRKVTVARNNLLHRGNHQYIRVHTQYGRDS